MLSAAVGRRRVFSPGLTDARLTSASKRFTISSLEVSIFSVVYHEHVVFVVMNASALTYQTGRIAQRSGCFRVHLL